VEVGDGAAAAGELFLEDLDAFHGLTPMLVLQKGGCIR
jgi:hypothetical protein